ncbi:Phytochrome, two-component sensor histidine kinase [hydrothermal vent metagenome]|uniref:histidine kinase n=1 Tax=hydrothermal vent metagenome TaxID=652676 RepID=A0A3B0XST1_9ZZZZ
MARKTHSTDSSLPPPETRSEGVPDKVFTILRHTLINDLLPALSLLNSDKEQLNPEQLYHLSQVNSIIERMELIAEQTPVPSVFSQGTEGSGGTPQGIESGETGPKETGPEETGPGEMAQVNSVLHALSYASTAMSTDEFFRYCVKTLATLYNCKYALISILKPGNKSVRTAAVWINGEHAENIEYDLHGTPCEDVICLKKVVIPSGVAQQYPKDPLLLDMAAESYFGAPLITTDKGILGLVAILDTEPMKINSWSYSALSVFAARITGEVLRHQALAQLKALNADLEKQVQQRTHDLEISNQQLNAFNYSVSHDLRAPVRTINGFMNVILEDYAQEFSKKNTTELRRIQKAGLRLSDIIESMLELSRISQQKIHLKQINLSLIAEKAINNILQNETYENIHVDIEPDLIVWADESLLLIALENLFGNAIKYSQNKAPAIIKLSCSTENKKTVFCIEDNGAGFNMDFTSQLFHPFRRLHSEKEFPGSGIGLATTKRVLDCHNGEIWAESSPGNGARFYFTLPAP